MFAHSMFLTTAFCIPFIGVTARGGGKSHATIFTRESSRGEVSAEERRGSGREMLGREDGALGGQGREGMQMGADVETGAGDGERARARGRGE